MKQNFLVDCDLNGNKLLSAEGVTSPDGTALAALRGYVAVTGATLTLTAAHHGLVVVLSNTSTVLVNVPASGLPGWFYCRVVSTTAGGFRFVAATGVTLNAPLAGYTAVRTANADADLYAVGTNSYILKSGYLSAAFVLNTLGLSPLLAASASRRLLPAYTGNLLEVRRSSDNTALGIGLSGDTLDTGALTTFVGSNSGYYKTLYDQSGNARHFGQATQTRQPRLIDAGTLETTGGRPCVRAMSAGSGSWLDAAMNFTTASLTIGVVGTLLNANNPGNYGRLVSIGNDGTNDYGDAAYAAPIRREPNQAGIRSERAGTTGPLLTISYGAPFSYVVKWDGSKMTQYLNGVASTPSDRSGNFNFSLVRLMMATHNTEIWDGTLSEFMAFGSALTDSQIASLHSDWKTFYSIS